MIEKRDIIIEEPDEDRQGWNMSGRSVSNGLKGYFSFFRDLRNRLHNSELIPKFSYRFRFYGSDPHNQPVQRFSGIQATFHDRRLMGIGSLSNRIILCKTLFINQIIVYQTYYI